MPKPTYFSICSHCSSWLILSSLRKKITNDHIQVSLSHKCFIYVWKFSRRFIIYPAILRFQPTLPNPSRYKTLKHFKFADCHRKANMSLLKLVSYIERLEDPTHPLMGPTIKGLYLFGLWQNGTKFRTISYNCVHIASVLFVLSEIIDLYNIRHDLNLVLNNISLTVLSVICVTKCFSYVLNQKKWMELINLISQQELKQIKKRDQTAIKIIKKYIKYTRMVTYLFWVLVFVTNLLLIVSPFLKYISKSYRDDVATGVQPLPQIMFSWFPFDNKKMPGYCVGILFHIFMGCQGSGIIAVFDMNAVAVMSYLQGQTLILKEKCRRIFECDSSRDVVDRIRECHKLHSVLVK